MFSSEPKEEREDLLFFCFFGFLSSSVFECCIGEGCVSSYVDKSSDPSAGRN